MENTNTKKYRIISMVCHHSMNVIWFTNTDDPEVRVTYINYSGDRKMTIDERHQNGVYVTDSGSSVN